MQRSMPDAIARSASSTDFMALLLRRVLHAVSMTFPTSGFDSLCSSLSRESRAAR